MALLTDGFATLISFANFPAVKFYEKTVTPPGMDGGGPNDTTTMRNTSLRTRQPKKLKTMTTIKARCAYDSDVFDPAEVWAMINVLQLITVIFADGAEIQFWGWLDKFEPEESKEGEQPTAMITVECANQDTDGAEQEPDFTAAV